VIELWQKVEGIVDGVWGGGNREKRMELKKR